MGRRTPESMRGNTYGVTHGMSQTPTYRTWRAMMKRCTNPNVDGYDRYGGRGVKVCDEWSRFEQFYADMGERPSLDHSIDRIDNDGDYEPGNCRWATRSEQQRNKTPNPKTECQRGHVYAETGVYYSKNGKYQCKQCALERARARSVRLRHQA